MIADLIGVLERIAQTLEILVQEITYLNERYEK